MFWSYHQPPQVTIINNSSFELKQVLLSGNNWKKSLQPLAPNDTRKVKINLTGESGLKISFRSGENYYEKDDLAYIESKGGYCVVITIDSQLNISSTGGVGCTSLIFAA